MLTTLGRFFFRFGLAFSVASVFVSAALLLSVGRVPEVLVRSSAVAAAISGDFMSSVGRVLAYSALGLGGLLTAVGLFFRGSATYVQLLQPYVLVVYLALFSIAADGCVTALSLLVDTYASALGAYGGTAVFAVKGSVLGLALASMAYYVLVKGFGAPAE